MKVVIFAGGLGTRLSEETYDKPKPMVEIGGKPIIWHIMKTYSHYGFNDFVVCLGYKGYAFKEYFSNYFLHMSDVTFDMRNDTTTVHSNECEPWKVTLIDTGLNTMTGGRLKRVKKYLDDEDFCLTYGDGLADLDLNKLVTYHKEHSPLITITTVQPPGRYGSLTTKDGRVTSFKEKPKGDGAWINGGFFIVNPKVIDMIEGDSVIWEREPLESVTQMGELLAYRHEGFWRCMDTLRDKNMLEELWNSGKAPWKTWE